MTMDGSGLDEKSRMLVRELEAAGWVSTSSTYRIRRLSDGIFSAGGSPPKWDRKGKTWRKKGDLNLHLENIRQSRSLFSQGGHPYEGCEVIESVVLTVESSRTPAMDVVAERARKHAEKAKR